MLFVSLLAAFVDTASLGFVGDNFCEHHKYSRGLEKYVSQLLDATSLFADKNFAASRGFFPNMFNTSSNSSESTATPSGKLDTLAKRQI